VLAVASFPDRVKSAAPEDNSQILPGLLDAHQEYSRMLCRENHDAVRPYASKVAGKL